MAPNPLPLPQTPVAPKLPRWLRSFVLGLAFAATAFATTSHAASFPQKNGVAPDNAQSFLGATFDHGHASPLRQSINDRGRTQLDDYSQRAAGLDQELAACQKNPEAFPPREALWAQSMAEAQQRGDPLLAIDMAQLVFNSSLGYDNQKAGDKKWAEDPRWILSMKDLARRGQGTCLDLAVAKYEWLSRVIGQENVYVLVGFSIDPQTKKPQAHAVCAAKAQGHFYILDQPPLNPVEEIAGKSPAYVHTVLNRLSFAEDAASFLAESGPREGIKLGTARGLFVPLFAAGGAQGLGDFKAFNNVQGIFWGGILYTPPQKLAESGNDFETHAARMAQNVWEATSDQGQALNTLLQNALGLHPSILPPEDFTPGGQTKDYDQGSGARPATVATTATTPSGLPLASEKLQAPKM